MNNDIEKIRERYIREVVTSKPKESKENITHVYTSIDNWNSDFKEFLQTYEIWEKEGYIEDFLAENDLTVNDLNNELIDEMVDYLYDEIISFDYEIYDNYMNANFDGDSIFNTNKYVDELLTNKSVPIHYYLENRYDNIYCFRSSSKLENIISDCDLNELYEISMVIDENTNNLSIFGVSGNSGGWSTIKYVDEDLGDFLLYDGCDSNVEQYIYDEIAIPLGYSLKDAMLYDVEVDLDKMRSEYYNKIENSYLVSPDTYEDIYNTYKEELDGIDDNLDDDELQEVMENAVGGWLYGDEYSSIHQNVISKLEKDMSPNDYTKNFNKQMDEYNLGKNQDINEKLEPEKPTKKMKM